MYPVDSVHSFCLSDFSNFVVVLIKNIPVIVSDVASDFVRFVIRLKINDPQVKLLLVWLYLYLTVHFNRKGFL